MILGLMQISYKIEIPSLSYENIFDLKFRTNVIETKGTFIEKGQYLVVLFVSDKLEKLWTSKGTFFINLL